MKQIFSHIQKKYNFSNYQIAQLNFLFKTIISETSKIFLMGILFWNHFTEYLYALCIMMILRCTTGGMHFYTYWSCFLVSVLYLSSAIYVLPQLKLPLYLKIILLLINIIICYFIGPVTSKYRPPMSIKTFKRSQAITCFTIFCYSILVYIIPENLFITIGFWIIILHTLQLIVAKLKRKEKNENGSIS